MLHGEGGYTTWREVSSITRRGEHYTEKGTLYGDGYIIEKAENYYRHKSVLNK